MKIGYNKIWGVLLLLLSGMVCCLTAAYVRLGEETPFYLAGLFWLPVVLGFLFLFRTYVEVNQNYVFVYGLAFGMKRYRVHTAKDFSIDGKSVFVLSEGVCQKLPVAAWLVDPGGWKSFLNWIQTNNPQVIEGRLE